MGYFQQLTHPCVNVFAVSFASSYPHFMTQTPPRRDMAIYDHFQISRLANNNDRFIKYAAVKQKINTAVKQIWSDVTVGSGRQSITVLHSFSQQVQGHPVHGALKVVAAVPSGTLGLEQPEASCCKGNKIFRIYQRRCRSCQKNT